MSFRLILRVGLCCVGWSWAALVGADPLEEPPTPLEEKEPRSERQRDHLEALSLFAAGRIAEQEDHLGEALKLYQRALRYEPDALPIVRQIVPLAFSLDRPNEAVRYALKAAELDPSDPLLLRQLGLHLAEAGRFEQALKLYQQARDHLKDQTHTAAYVMLSMELGRLCFITDHAKEAAEAFALVLPVLDKPDEYGLNETQRKMFTGADGARNLDLFAETFLAAGRPADALAAYEKLQQLRPDKGLHAYHLARVAEQNGDHLQALTELQTYFDQKGVSAGPRPYALLQRLLGAVDEQDALVPRLEAIVAAQPANLDARTALAAASLAQGKFESAEKIFQELLKAQPGDEQAYAGLIKIYRQREQWNKLIKILGDAAVDRDSIDLLDDTLKDLARDEKIVKQLIATAREEYGADADRLDYGDRMALALLAVEARQFDAAGEFFALALKVKREDAGALFEAWGVGLIMAEQYADAARVFQQAIDEQVLPAGNTTFHHYLAGVLEMAGRTDDALAVARAAIAMPDAPPRMHARLAWVLYHAKRNTEAEEAYRDFLTRFDSPSESEDLRGLVRDARLVLSNLYATRHEMKLAEEMLEQVLDEYPENIGALNDLGYLWVEQNKNLDRAVRMIEQAVAGDPDNEAYLDSLGWAYYQLGRYAEAVEELKKAVAAGGENPDGVILEHLADAYLKNGQKEEASQTWRQALATFEREKDPVKAAAVRKKLE